MSFLASSLTLCSAQIGSKRKSRSPLGRLRLLGPWRDASTEHEPLWPSDHGRDRRLGRPHAVWHHFHSICQEGQSAITCHTIHSVTAMSACSTRMVEPRLASKKKKNSFGIHSASRQGALARRAPCGCANDFLCWWGRYHVLWVENHCGLNLGYTLAVVDSRLRCDGTISSPPPPHPPRHHLG